MTALQEHDYIQVRLARNLTKFFENCSHAPNGRVYLEFAIPGKNDPVGYLDLLVEVDGRGIAIEVKSHIESIGETLRQISKYKAAAPWCDCPYRYGQKVHINSSRHYAPEFFIASPDFRYIDVIESQGIRFLKVGEEARHRSSFIKSRVKDLIGEDFLTAEENAELDGLIAEYRRYHGVAALNLAGVDTSQAAE